MIVVTEKQLKASKKPVQVYFESEVLVRIQEKLNTKGGTKTMSDYLRELVDSDLNLNRKKKKNKRAWMDFRLDMKGVSSDPREMDKIIYNV